jgi:hypothetical protein
MQPFMLTLESGGESGKEIIVHTGHEFVMCLQGRLEYEVEGKLYTLEAGDSLLFAARLAHRWRSPGNTITNAIIVLSGFEEYEKPGNFHTLRNKEITSLLVNTINNSYLSSFQYTQSLSFQSTIQGT